MTLTDEYYQLKQKLIFHFGISDEHDKLLGMLKHLYKDEINSKRRYEQIKTIGQLLNVLELRYVLSRNDVTLLRNIARKLSNEDLLREINHYSETHNNKDESINSYACPSTSKLHENETLSSTIIINPYPSNLCNLKKERIFNTVKEQVGIYWRDLGRNLGIPEGIIDEIDATSENAYSKATKIIEQYLLRCDPQRWFLKLCDALEKSRRKDLSKALQEIMTMNFSWAR